MPSTSETAPSETEPTETEPADDAQLAAEDSASQPKQTDTDSSASEDTSEDANETAGESTSEDAAAMASEDAPVAEAEADSAPVDETASQDTADENTAGDANGAQTAQAGELEGNADENADAPADAPADQTAETAPEPAADSVTDPAADSAADPATTITEDIVAALPRTGASDGTVGDLAPNVTTNRLPSVTGDGAEDSSSASAVAPPPLERFASDAVIEPGKPLMSIVLIDDGSTDLGVEALDSFPYPLTFAVDASTPDAAERMALYRARGLEVVALVSMPQGATASDAEVAMAGYLAAVPEAVAILEDASASLQVNRGVSDQVIEILQSSGHGAVFQASGLNTAQKLAVREGVASARVFRDFDGSGQNATVIRRFLDQAAFRAGQEGGVVMLGRLRAETISALLIWGLADRASRVALVPVSAVLQGSLEDEG